MHYRFHAACFSDTGRVRPNNEDNFYFGGQFLPMINTGTEKPLTLRWTSEQDNCLAVFDGMGGENFGEAAAYVAAETMAEQLKNTTSDLTEAFLSRLSLRLNETVFATTRTYLTERMGTTLVALGFSNNKAFLCNLGDSRAYLLRDGELKQISADHVSLQARPGQKAPLTQHLGIDPEKLRLEPFSVTEHLEGGDVFLLCSDGISDMIPDEEIKSILIRNRAPEDAVRELVGIALEHGGRDNATAIVCAVNATGKVDQGALKKRAWLFVGLFAAVTAAALALSRIPLSHPEEQETAEIEEIAETQEKLPVS